MSYTYNSDADCWCAVGVGIQTEKIPFSTEKVLRFLRSYLGWNTDETPESFDLDRFFQDTPLFSNRAEMLYEADDSNLLWSVGSDYRSFLYYPAKLPWEQSWNEPKTLAEVKSLIVRCVRSLSDMSEKEILGLIDEDLYVVDMY